MRNILKALLFAGIVSISAHAAPVWSAAQTVIKVAQHPDAGAFVVGQNASTSAIVKCYIRTADADDEKAIFATALTQKASGGTALFYLEFITDPWGVVAGTPCILRGIQAE